jgi:hypothetical protein
MYMMGAARVAGLQKLANWAENTSAMGLFEKEERETYPTREGPRSGLSLASCHEKVDAGQELTNPGSEGKPIY